ncbi:MAG: mechanosensitive ion channel domain-containing protein [Spirochaetota bacterium]
MTLPALSIDLSRYLNAKNLDAFVNLSVIILIVLFAFQLLQFTTRRLIGKRVTGQTLMLVRKGIRYTSFTVVALLVFERLGINLSALLGAAGIAGIAIGFAAQTSVSNIISGLFIVWEKSFTLGDVIQAGDATGTVVAIDLLSIKLQTFDNRYVRVPNETLIKSNVVNVTHYPIRRMDIKLTISYVDDLGRAVGTLRAVAAHNLLVLDNPETLVLVDSFSEKGVEILFGLWFLQSDFLELRNSIMQDIRSAFAEEGFGLPVLRIVLEAPTAVAGLGGAAVGQVEAGAPAGPHQP